MSDVNNCFFTWQGNCINMRQGPPCQEVESFDDFLINVDLLVSTQ